MNSTEAIKKIALNNVVNPDFSFILRKISRWYSTTFHTPLHEVEEMEFEYILLHYFEHNFDLLEKTDLNKQIELILETPEDRKKREMVEEANDAEFLRVLEEEEKLKVSLGNLPKQEVKQLKDTLPEEIKITAD